MLVQRDKFENRRKNHNYTYTYIYIYKDCSASHRASNFNFFRVRFCVDGRGAAAGLCLVEVRHDFETESTTRKMQVGKKGKELKGRKREGPEPRTVCTMYI